MKIDRLFAARGGDGFLIGGLLVAVGPRNDLRISVDCGRGIGSCPRCAAWADGPVWVDWFAVAPPILSMPAAAVTTGVLAFDDALSVSPRACSGDVTFWATAATTTATGVLAWP